MEEELISFIREHEFMYNKKSKLYKCTNIKERKWAEISERTGVGIVELKKRWKTLRDRFKREEAKRNLLTGELPRKISWKFYESLKFLREKREPTSKFDEHYHQLAQEISNNEHFVEQMNVAVEEVNVTVNTFDPIDETKQENVVLQEVWDNTTTTTNNLNTTNRTYSTATSIETTTLIDTTRNNHNLHHHEPIRKKRKPQKEIFVESTTTTTNSELNNILEILKAAIQQTSIVRSFFNSMALQVEQANLSFERFASLQRDVLRAVHEQISSQNEENQNQIAYT